MRITSWNQLARPRLQWNFRRGLLVALDGLAVSVLAVLIASYARGHPLTAGQAASHLVWLETVRGWLATPGVDLFEVTAYLGLAVTVAGPLWYWATAPAAGRLRGVIPHSDSGRVSTGFQFDHPAEHRPSDRPNDQLYRPPAGNLSETRPTHVTPSADWVEALFDGPSAEDSITGALASGDFLRSSGGAASRSTRTGHGASVPPEPTADTASGRKPRGRPVSSVDDNWSRDRRYPVSYEGPNHDSDMREPDGGSEPAGHATSPIDTLTSSVADARGTLDAVENYLGVGGDGGPKTAAETVSIIANRADDQLRRVRSALPDGEPPAGDVIAEIRESEVHLESAFEPIRPDD